jgi:hypothetical protein
MFTSFGRWSPSGLSKSCDDTYSAWAVVFVCASIYVSWEVSVPNDHPVGVFRVGDSAFVVVSGRTDNSKGKSGLIVSCQLSAMSCQLEQKQVLRLRLSR